MNPGFGFGRKMWAGKSLPAIFLPPFSWRLVLLLLACSFANAAERTPNFVIIFTDDQGYGDLSCYGAKHVSTPRIDQMAGEGSRLTSFYVAAPVCTPSRAGLMTGCDPKRIDMAVGSNFGVLLAGDRKGFSVEDTNASYAGQKGGIA